MIKVWPKWGEIMRATDIYEFVTRLNVFLLLPFPRSNKRDRWRSSTRHTPALRSHGDDDDDASSFVFFASAFLESANRFIMRKNWSLTSSSSSSTNFINSIILA